jgi:hypothetical protein
VKTLMRKIAVVFSCGSRFDSLDSPFVNVGMIDVLRAIGSERVLFLMVSVFKSWSFEVFTATAPQLVLAFGAGRLI